MHHHTCMHVPHTTSPNRGLTDLAAGEPSSICADTAPLCGSRADTCRMTERGVWSAKRPVPPGTQQPPDPQAGTSPHQLHTAPGLGTAPHTGGQQSTPGELQHSRWGREWRRRWILWMATHLREDKREKRCGVKVRYIALLLYELLTYWLYWM